MLAPHNLIHGLLYSRTERLFDVADHWAENVRYNAFFRPDTLHSIRRQENRFDRKKRIIFIFLRKQIYS